MLVPPTAVTYGSDGGHYAYGPSEEAGQTGVGSSAPQSPLLKQKPMPSAAPCLKICSKASLSAWPVLSSSSRFHELLTIVASLMSTIRLSASCSSSTLQDDAATYTTFASGAMSCTAVTSRDSSTYQALPPQSATLFQLLGRLWEN